MTTAQQTLLIAGATASETLHTEGFTGPVALLGEDSERPYHRPPLSKDYLPGRAERAEIPGTDHHATGVRPGDGSIIDTVAAHVRSGRPVNRATPGNPDVPRNAATAELAAGARS